MQSPTSGEAHVSESLKCPQCQGSNVYQVGLGRARACRDCGHNWIALELPEVPAKSYRKGAVALVVPPGHYVEIQPGTGTYHHPDCFMATADWDGADSAKLGKRIARSPEEIEQLGLRPAQCCEPPIFRRSRPAT